MFTFDHKLHQMLMAVKAEPEREKRLLLVKGVCDYMKSKGRILAYVNELMDPVWALI